MKTMLQKIPSLAILGVVASSFPSANAVDYFLQQNQFSPNNWETVNSTNSWYDSPAGGSQLTSFDVNGDYFNNGFTLRTPSTQDTFGGNSLNLSGGSLLLAFHDASIDSTVGTLNVEAGGSSLSTNNFDNTLGGGLNVTALTLNGALDLGTNDFRRVRLNVDTLLGSSDIIVGAGSAGSGSRANLSALDASSYTGNVNLNLGRLNFDNDFTSAGGLNIASGTTFVLDQSLTFSALTIAGDTLSEGTYSYATLNSTYDSIFQDGGSGSITVAAVPEPSTTAMALGAVSLGLMMLRRRKRQA
ncbi:PEP-CTERM sorting domain-containing protein [Cerasicoccus fimbriatus]|uniref:PEP-CTERM sorting domain-containing protein n=1 Tax=Cerasicoccus fimbriatus TaxID=3014554 RepID=UPI0022B2DD17|nr:PEP-CTERM sorting domain-containing protein [Cerasicoccus sp. TK19100]